ncbi:MAG: carboxypeptidase-like regulatory domain-containing protein, partial [Nanoarchaeota archaeon]|nr:carboxypeptidase-like regulatory domain-containing protein [Nanoarchaeota archaeon]
SGGPGLWSRFWDWRDKRNKEKGEQHPPLDYKNPCTVKVKVVDLHDNPINGAKVTITGVKDWSFRDQEITDVDGNIKRAFSNIPSGHFHIEARHPNYKFWSLQLGTEKNKRHREVVVSGGETADVLVRMDRVEELGVVKGRIIDEDKAKAETRVNRKSKGSTLNDKAYEIGNKDLKQVVALERVERGTGVEYVDMGVNAVTTDADGYFEMQKLPLGKNFVIGTPIDIPGHRNCYVTHLGWVIDNILYRGTKYGRGGQGGSNDPPPKDIYLGKKGGDWNVPHEKGFSKLKYAWTVPRGAVSKISKWTKYYGNEDNVVISFTKKVSVIGTVRGKVVNGSYVIKHMLSRPPKYANAADIINDTKRWPRGPGLPNSKVRATYYFEDRTNPRQATPWVPAGLDGMYTLFVPVTAIDVVVEVRLEPHGGGSVKVGVHVGWPLGQCPAGTPNAPFDLTPGATDRNDVLLPIWGVSLPDVKVI